MRRLLRHGDRSRGGAGTDREPQPAEKLHPDGAMATLVPPTRLPALGSGDALAAAAVLGVSLGAHEGAAMWDALHGQSLWDVLSAAARTGGLTQLTARFNLISGNKLFCVADEIADKAGTANYANLKSLADRKKIEIEGKYLDTVEVNDHRNFVMCTNYKNAFGFDGDTDDFSRKVALFEVRQLHLVRMRASPSPRSHTPTPRAASDPICKSANPSK